MSSYESRGRLEDIISASDFEEVKSEFNLPEGLDLGDLTTALKYGDPRVIGFSGSAASGKTTTALEMAKLFAYIGRPVVYIKFPTKDSYFGRKLHERLNTKEGSPNQYPKKGDNVRCNIQYVDWENSTAEVFIEGFERKASIYIPKDDGSGRLQNVKGIFLEKLLEDYREAEEQGKNLLKEVFKQGESIVCTVEQVDRRKKEIEVIPRRWKKSSFLKDSVYMLLNFFEKRSYIKRALSEGYFVFLDRGRYKEWLQAPPEVVNSYFGIWVENLLKRVSYVGKGIDIAHIVSPEKGMERIEDRKIRGEADDQSYDSKKIIKCTRWNQIKSYIRMKRKVKTKPPRKRRDLSHLNLEELATEAERAKRGSGQEEIGEADIIINYDGQSEMIVDTEAKSRRFIRAAGIAVAGLSAGAVILRKILEEYFENQ